MLAEDFLDRQGEWQGVVGCDIQGEWKVAGCGRVLQDEWRDGRVW